MSPSTTFTLQTLDGGSNPQAGSQAGVEAVSAVITTLRVHASDKLRDIEPRYSVHRWRRERRPYDLHLRRRANAGW